MQRNLSWRQLLRAQAQGAYEHKGQIAARLASQSDVASYFRAEGKARRKTGRNTFEERMRIRQERRTNRSAQRLRRGEFGRYQAALRRGTLLSGSYEGSTPAARNRRSVAALRDRADELRAAGKYVSPFGYRASYPVAGEPAINVPKANIRSDTQHRIAQYGDELRARFSKENIEYRGVRGSTVQFRMGKETISLPLLGPVYSRTKGEVSGYQGGVNLIRQSASGKAYQTSEEAILNDIRSSKDFKGLRKAVEETHRYLRHKDVSPYMRGVPALRTGMDMLSSQQYKWGRRDTIPSSALSKKVQDLGYEGFRFGGSALYGMRGNIEFAIKDIQDIGVLIPELLDFASKRVGRSLDWDIMSDAAPLAGRFTSFGPADLDPFGNIQKRGYKGAQQFSTIGLNIGAMGGYAQSVGDLGLQGTPGALFGGRALRTHIEREASARAASMMPEAILRAGSKDIVSGLNVPGILLFGDLASQLPETESVAITRELASKLKQGTGLGHVGISTPVFTSSTSKGNLITTDGLYGMGDAHIARAAHFKTPAELVRSMMYGYIGAGQEKGLTWEAITGALRRSIGSNENMFLLDSTEAVLKSGERLFTDPSTGVEESMEMLRRFGQEMGGITPKDFINRDSSGAITGMRLMEHIGVREQALGSAKSYLQHGLGFGGGQKVAQNYAAIFRGLGSPTLAKLFTDVRADDTLMKALDFRRNVLGSIGHLIDPSMENIHGMGKVSSVSVDELRVSIASRSSEVNKLLALHRKEGSYAGIAEAMQKRGILPELWEGAGFNLRLGANVPVYDTLSTSYASTPVKGIVSEIAIPNVGHTNIKDLIASRVLRMAAGQDVDRHASALSMALLEQYLGGKKSLIAQLASPRIGSEMIHTVQKATTLDPMDYNRMVNEYLDNLHKAGKLTTAQRQAMDPTKQRYAFMSSHRARELSAEHRAIYREQQFLRSIAVRDPVKGRGMAMRLLMPLRKYMPKQLQGLLGGEGLVTGISDINFLEGDTDFDRIRTLIAEGVDGDRNTWRLMKGFEELETSQMKTLQHLDATTAARVIEERRLSTIITEDYLSALEGRGTSKELQAMFAKTMTSSNRAESLLATTGLKALTGYSYDPAVNRQIISEAMTVAGGASPFGAADDISKYYMQDFLPGMQQLFISKHNVKGKQSLDMITNMTAAVHAAALARSSGDVGPAAAASAYEKAVSAVRGIMVDVHAIAGKETNVAFSGGHAEELFGIIGRPSKVDRILTNREAMEAALTTGRGKKTVEAIVKAEISMADHLDWMNDVRPGSQYKDAYTTQQTIDQLGTVYGKAPAEGTVSPKVQKIRDEIGRMKNAQMDAGVEALEGAAAQKARVDAAAFKEEVAQATSRGMKDVGSKDLSSAFNNIRESVLDSIHKNPKAYGLAGLAAGGLLALGVLNWAGRKVDQWTSPAGQETGVPMSPRSEYFVPEESMIGHQLNGTMRLTPDAMPALIQGFNRTDPRADIRVMDTRMGMSDRVLGYDAENTMSSLYARKQI